MVVPPFVWFVILMFLFVLNGLNSSDSGIHDYVKGIKKGMVG